MSEPSIDQLVGRFKIVVQEGPSVFCLFCVLGQFGPLLGSPPCSAYVLPEFCRRRCVSMSTPCFVPARFVVVNM